MKTPTLFTVADSIENYLIVYANNGDDVAMQNPAATSNLPNGDVAVAVAATESPMVDVQSKGAAAIKPSSNGAATDPETTTTEAAAESSNAQTMDKLELPWSDKYWNLFITNPKSTIEIWGRLIGPDYSVSCFLCTIPLWGILWNN